MNQVIYCRCRCLLLFCLVLYLTLLCTTAYAELTITGPAIVVPGFTNVPPGHWNEICTYISSDASLMVTSDWISSGGLINIISRTWNEQTLWNDSQTLFSSVWNHGGDYLSPDHQTLFFHSVSTMSPDIYRSHYINGSWQTPELLSAVSTSGLDFNPSFNGKQLFFQRENDIWFSDYNSATDTFTVSQPVTAINTSAFEGNPWISSDGLLLVFTSDKDNGYGGRDLWYSTRINFDTNWSTPMNLGPNVNTSQDEQEGKIAETAGRLYFERAPSGAQNTLMQAPVPEPATLSLLLLGGLGLMRRRKA
jgi:hypothetical protein